MLCEVEELVLGSETSQMETQHSRHNLIYIFSIFLSCMYPTGHRIYSSP